MEETAVEQKGSGESEAQTKELRGGGIRWNKFSQVLLLFNKYNTQTVTVLHVHLPLLSS